VAGGINRVCVGNTRVVAGYWDMTAVNFLGSFFEKWRGSLTYKYVFHSSPLLRVRIGIMVIPPGAATPTVFSANGTVLSHVIEVVGTTEYEFTVPYMMTAPWSSTVKGTDGQNSAYPGIVFFILAGPFGPAGTPPTIVAQVWIKGGPDLEFGIPSLKAIASWKAIPEGGPVGERSIQSFGEVIDDLHLLTKRSEKLVNLVILPSNPANMGGFALPIVPPPKMSFNSSLYGLGTQGQTNWTWASYLTRAYIGQMGSYIYRFTGALQGDDIEVPIVTTAYRLPGYISNVVDNPDLWNGRGSSIRNTKDNSTLEFRFPSRESYNYTTGQNWAYESADNNAQECYIYDNAFRAVDTGPVVRLNVAVACGDDFMFGGYLCPPALSNL